MRSDVLPARFYAASLGRTASNLGIFSFAGIRAGISKIKINTAQAHSCAIFNTFSVRKAYSLPNVVIFYKTFGKVGFKLTVHYIFGFVHRG